MQPAPKSPFAYVDGSTPSRSGRASRSAGIGVVLHDAQGELLTISRPVPAHHSSNQLEYLAILAALEAAREVHSWGLTVYCDSLRVVERIHTGNTLPGCDDLRQRVRVALAALPFASVVSVCREEVAQAHDLAQAARMLREEVVTRRGWQ
jgi:ribonuclease HI